MAGAGSDPTLGATEYRVNVNAATGAVTLSKSGSNVTFTTTTGGALPSSLGSIYTMTLSATYSSPTQALIEVSVTSGASSFTATYNDNSAIVGSHFGYRIARATGDGTVSVFFDDFSLATIPEPSVTGLLMASALGFLRFRRR